MTGLTGEALNLYRAVLLRTSDPSQQAALLVPLARTVGASSRDIANVKAFLERDQVRECGR